MPILLFIRNKKGYSLLEVVLALAVVSIFLGAFFNLIIGTSNVDLDLSGKTVALRIGTGIVQIGNYYIQMIANKCGLPATGSSWGWSYCAASAYPYPSVSGTNLVYVVPSAGSGLTASDINALKSYMISTLSSCSVTDSGTTMTFNCNSNGFSLFRLDYRLNSGSIIDATTVNANTFYTTVSGLRYLDYIKMPIQMQLHFDIAGTSIQYRDTNALSFYNDFVLHERNNETLLRYTITLRTLRSYGANRFFTEVSSNQTGLKSVSALYVPWAWQVLGTQGAANVSRACVLSGDVCDYNATTEWVGAIASADVTMWRRVMTNLNLENKYTIDGYGNPLHLVPLTAPCIAASPGVAIPSCDINTVFGNAAYAPQIPRKNYVYNATYDIKPPFSSAIFNRVCMVSTTIPSNLCIMIDVYPN